MADIPKLPGFIRRRIEEAINWKPAPGSMTLGDGKVRVLGADLNYLLLLIDAHEAAALPQQPTPSPKAPMSADELIAAEARSAIQRWGYLWFSKVLAAEAATPSEAVQGKEKQE